MTHCDCADCQKDRKLLKTVRELLPLLLFMARAQAVASTTTANKWRELEGESIFRRMKEEAKTMI